MTTKEKLQAAVKSLLAVAAIGYVGWYLSGRREQVSRLLELSVLDIAALIALMAIGIFVRGGVFHTVVNKLGGAMTFRESTTLTAATTLLNYLPLNAGLFVRGHVLKRHRAVPYASYVALMAAIVLCNLVASGALGLLALAAVILGWTPGDGHVPPETLLGVGLLFGGGIVAPIAVLHTPVRWVGEGKGWLRGRVRTLLDGWRQLRGRTLVVVCLLAATRLVLVASRFLICLRVLSVEGSLLAAVMFAAVTSLLLSVNVTPGSLGIRELLTAVIAQGLGLDFADGLLAAGIDRVAAVAFVLVCGVPSLVYLRSRGLT